MFLINEHGNVGLKKSIFGHFYQNKESVCAYNALKMTTIYFQANLLGFILATVGQTVNSILPSIPVGLRAEYERVIVEICRANIFVSSEYNELSYLDKIKPQIFVPPNIRVMVLHLSDNCNLACRYCFIEGNIKKGYKRRNMPREVVDQSLEKFAQIIRGKNFSQNPSIVFYGGEPLCNWPIIKHCLEYLTLLQARGDIIKELDKVLITNGTLVTNEIARTLKKYNVLPAVSIDGFREAHNINRIFRNGKGSFDRAIEGFQILKDARLKPTIATVLSNGNIPFANDIIRWFVDELGVKAFGFNHISIVPGKNKYDPEYEQRVADTILGIQDIIQSSYPDVYERRMNRKLNCFLDQEIMKADCTGCGEQISISTNGQIGICQGYMGSRKTFNNTVFNSTFLPENDSVFKEWSRRSPLNMEQCYTCPALSTCGGGCPRNADFLHGSIWERDSAFCHFAIKAQEWMIWKKHLTKK